MLIATDRAWGFRIRVSSVAKFTQIRPYWIQDSSTDLTDDEIRAELKRCNRDEFTEICLKSISVMEQKRESQGP